MFMKSTSLLICFLFSVFCTSCMTASLETTTAEETAKLNPHDYVLEVNVTSQQYNFVYPWVKNKPYSKSGMGVLINGGQLLVHAGLIQDHTFIELEKISNGAKATAKLIHVDYHAGLALIEPVDREFIKGMASLPVSDKLAQGRVADAWAFDKNGNPQITDCKLIRAEADVDLLTYRFDIALPSYARAPSGTPVVMDGELVGLTKSHTQNTNSLLTVSAQVIDHFLKDMHQNSYQGFPSAGFGFSLLDDPQLRSYLSLPETENGVYVTYVRPGSGAAKAGLQKEDVVLALDEFDLDRRGMYEDPDYGKLKFGHLINTKSYAGSVRNFRIWRDGKIQTLPLTLTCIPVETYPIEPYIHDRGADYIVTSGLVMQELSGQLLAQLRKNPPQHLTYYERNQWELIEPGRKIVILISLIPTEGLRFYEQRDYLFRVLTELNGKPIKNLKDVSAALKAPVSKNGGLFHHFMFEQAPRELVLDAVQTERDNGVVQQQFRIPKLQHFRK
ncbi:hypothetical protein BVY04_03945 [bacterium M21]|nr:hypothetical protein BVY04_03945 [bacterium M21]